MQKTASSAVVKSGEVAWVSPKEKGTKAGPRSGHTLNCVQEKCILFGGCGVGESASAVFNDTYLIHIADGYRWEKVNAMGDIPHPRWRHTATTLPDNNSIFVFGGLCKGKRFNDSHVYDVARREWCLREVAGVPPHPRSHHTATLVEFDEEEDGEAEKKIFIIGGYGGIGSARDFSLDVHALDLDTWSWSKIERIKGIPPKPRADHTVCVADNLLILAGGRGASGKGFSGYFDDVHILDLAEQEWKRPPSYSPEGNATWPALPTPLWNHTAIAVESVPSYRMFVFGGQKAEFVYSDNCSVLDTGRMMWTNPIFAHTGGGAPSAREDCGCAYDSKTCNVLFFGGWRQGWLDDLWCLNVAGIVGPPYAVQSLSPVTGPVTGNTPISIYGIGFVESTQVQVKFSDGRREATVPGKFVSSSEITCNTPSFEKFGPMEVMVRVAIKGDPFTVNKAMFSFFVNTKAARCMVFGPALLPGKAGHCHKMIMQGKDSTGKARSSGEDQIKVVISGDHISDPIEAKIVDFKDGHYEISYIPPSPGVYEVSVMLDENAFDDDDSYLHIRGSPFSVTFSESWVEPTISGSAPMAKDQLRVWSKGNKVVVVPEEKDEEEEPPVDDDDDDDDELEGEPIDAIEAPIMFPPAEDTSNPDTIVPASAPEMEAEGEEAPAQAEPMEDGAAAPSEAPASATPEDVEEAIPEVAVEAVQEAVAPVQRKQRKTPRAAPKQKPDPEQVYVLDMDTMSWSSTRDVAELCVNEASLASERRRTLKKAGIKDSHAERLLATHRLIHFDRMAGFTGDIPMSRVNFLTNMAKLQGQEALYIYGGQNSDGDSFDDLYHLNLHEKKWTCLYRGETVNKLSAEGKKVAFCGSKLVEVGVGAPGVLDSIRVLEINELFESLTNFVPVMVDHLKTLFDKVEAQVKEVAAVMGTEPQDGDFEGLRSAMGGIFTISNQSETLEYDLDTLHEIASYLQSTEKGSVSAIASKASALHEEWVTSKKAMPGLRKAIKPQIESHGTRIKEEINSFTDEVEAHRKKFLSESVFSYETGAEDAYEVMDVMHIDLKDIEKEAGNMRELANLFEFPELVAKMTEVVRMCRRDVVLIKKLWDLSSVVTSTITSWNATLWNDINTAVMEEESKVMSKQIKALDKRLRDFDAYQGLEQYLKNFLVVLPCVADLRSPSMRPRHWKQLMDITGKSFELTDKFCLADLTALELHKFVDDVGEVVDRAQKEDKMEQSLAKLDLTWQSIEFEFEQHRDTPVYLMRLKEEDFETLEDNQLAVQGMMASKYLATFEEDVTGWQKKLGNVSEVLTHMTEVQRKWAYLETLFIGSDEVKKELPESTKRFVGIDGNFRSTLKDFHDTKNAVTACNTEGLIAKLEQMESDLELCEKDLADFLEAKKRIFPRFYFLSTTMLLDILSNGNRPWIVEKSINAMFQGVSKLILTGDPAVTVTHLVSNEGEEVELKKKGSLRLTGKVEDYLGVLIQHVRDELLQQVDLAIDDYQKRERKEWLFDHIAQLCIVVTQWAWTKDTQQAFIDMTSGNSEALKTYQARQIQMLGDLITLVQGSLDKLQRRKIMNMITMETHSRDINKSMIDDGFTTKDCFKWVGQLKTSYEARVGDSAKDIWADICDASFRYSFEYLGNGARLVITPLTDRLYITATQACHLKLGCAPAGPAGTGKTETTKDLSAALGKAVYVFNCGPEMDYRTMGDIFKGLASSGSWGCFDEFNRLVPEVLSVCSVQYKAVLDGMRAGANDFSYEGVTYFLHPQGCMSFITMNPGYLGRAELPESLKVLFRPVTVMVPDLSMIMENMLMAEGYLTAAVLAKKFFTLYSLLKDLLSKQLHYDWGLRAIKSVLVQAGNFKRGEPDQPEGGLLMRALRDFNLPKIVEDDMVVFLGLIKDLWPDMFESMPRARDTDFEKLVSDVAVESNLQPNEYFIQNVVDLQDLLDIRHCVFTIGDSGNNKTEAWKTLAKAWTKGGVRGKTIYRDINPKALTSNELYGFVNLATREWKDGLLSSTMRELANASDTNPKWIILDGDLDANWIENMNSVMDDNRLLTLASNERIRLLPHLRMIFEIRDLAYASPATVTRAGVLFISERGQWKNFVYSWIENRERNEPASMNSDVKKARADKLRGLFDKYCPTTMLEIKKNFKTVVPMFDFSFAQALCYFLEGLLIPENVGSKDASSYEQYFVMAAVWAFGSSMSLVSGVDYRKEFSRWWKDTWKTVKFPHRGEVFDWYIDKRKGEFAQWAESVPAIVYDSNTPMSMVTVPTGETASINFFLDLLIQRSRPAMLLGPAGVGKTAIIMGKLRSLSEDYIHSVINVNYYTNFASLLKQLESPLEKKAGKNFGPPGNKKLIYFVDDLNMAALDKYNTATNISLMRQHMGYGHIYDLNKLSQKVLLNTQYLSSMNPTAGSFVINPRLQRLFATFAIGFPSAESLNTIYSTFLGGHLKNFSEDVKELSKKIVQGALQLHKRVASTFRKSAVCFHYEFNIRHLAGIFQGMLMAKPEQMKDPVKLVQLWLHESERIYSDRLVSLSDQKKYRELATEQSKKYFKEFSPTQLFSDPLIFCHFAQGVGDKLYDKVTSFSDLSALLTSALTEYNELNAVMDLVLFEDAMRHVSRISRIIESPGGHGLLVGVGGSGKQSLAKLATYVAGYSVSQIVISATYSVNDLKTDLQQMYRKAGIRQEGIAFLFTDSQITDEKFLVFMNDLLSSGSIPGLFPPEDTDDIINAVRPACKRAGIADSRDNVWTFFINQVKANLHVLLCFSPIGDPIRVRARRFPALVNCVVIDWFQPWPEEALASVSKRFLDHEDLGSEEAKATVINFMPYSFISVDKVGEQYVALERRHNYTTPKSFLELIALYRSMLGKRRFETNKLIDRYVNGVTKLESTGEQVAGLEEELKVKAVEVEEKKAAADAMIPKLEAEKSKASEEAERANAIAAEATKKEIDVAAMVKSIEEDLAAAEPALVAAAAALDSINKKDLGELKNLKSPPPGIDDVTGACIYLLHDGSKGKIDISWKASQALMKDVNVFMSDLMAYKERIDAGAVPKQNFKNIRPLLAKEHFNVETMRNKSAAAAGLTDFVLNITFYWDINEEVEPKRQAAASATQQLQDAIAAKDAALAKKAEAEATVADLESQYNSAVKEKEEAMKEAENCAKKLGLAVRLMSALGSEGARWKQSILDLKAQLLILPGDALLAAAFVSYSGCFSKRFRQQLLDSTFLPYLKGELGISKGGVPLSEGADPLTILTTEAERAVWARHHLPTDRVSVENGAIVCNCARWPLLIDPQLQGITWIKTKEENAKVCRLGQKTLINDVEAALSGGLPLVIENLGLSYDAVLAPIVGRQILRRGRATFVKLGDKEVDCEPGFKLYLQTKLSNPHYPPEIQAETTLINFMVTEDGLEDQLLALTVRKERPDLEEQKAELISQTNENKIEIKSLEDGILEQLANAEGDVLDNIALIENLEESKKVSAEIAEKMLLAEDTEKMINASRESYREVASRGSLMFFLLTELNRIHSFHHYSLNSFIIVFQTAVTGKRARVTWTTTGNALLDQIIPGKRKGKWASSKVSINRILAAGQTDEDLLKRLKHLLDSITYQVFTYARRGLFDRHKLILSTQLCLKILTRDGKLRENEVHFLLNGPKVGGPVPPMSTQVQAYVSDAQWAALHSLSMTSDVFKPVQEDLELSSDAWKEWIDLPMPEEEGSLSPDWDAKLTAFQKILLIRALRPDRVTAAVSNFVRVTLGDRYIDQEPFNMKDTFADSSAPTPLFFVLFPGVDPGEDIEKLGRELGFTESNGRYKCISMGQGQEANAEAAIQHYAKEGGWVFLQNVHLMESWLPQLERKLEIAAETGHDDFRCFLSAEPPPLPYQQSIPEGIMQSSIKVANEPPADLKSNLRQSYALFSQAVLDKSTKPDAHRPMLFALCFFHALVLGRRKFGFQGFSRQYPFNNGDLTVCAAVLHNYLERNATVPYDDIRYNFGEIMYGGHITDEYDRRITNTYLQVLIEPKLLDESSDHTLAPGYKVLRTGKFKDYREYIEEALPAESPVLFGLHPNSQISLLQAQAHDLFSNIIVLSGGSASGTVGSGKTKEAKAGEMVEFIQNRLPDRFPMIDIKAKVGTLTPYVVCGLQELERCNIILTEISRALAELALGLAGALNISDTMDHLIADLSSGSVPLLWLKICGQMGPTGSYNRKTLSAWFMDLLHRVKQLREWSDQSLTLPKSIWIAGLFNPMGYVTACMQVTARAKGLPLDSMTVHTEVTQHDLGQISAQPEEGTYVHGLFLEGARWDKTNNCLADSFPKELHPSLPVLYIKGVEAADVVDENVYMCPVYTTTIRGPTFTFRAPLRTEKPPWVWVLAGVALLCQPDQ